MICIFRQGRIRTYADLFELTKDLGEPVASYSHGMKQKLAVISAWVHQPKLILMDEPFVGLDPKASHILKNICFVRTVRFNRQNRIAPGHAQNVQYLAAIIV